MRKLLVIMMLLVIAGPVGAHTISKFGVTVDVDNYGQITKFSQPGMCGGVNLLDIQRVIIAYKLQITDPYTVLPIDSNWSARSSVAQPDYVWSAIEKMITPGKFLNIQIETRINSDTYYDQRYRVAYSNGCSKIYDVRFLTYTKPSDIVQRSIKMTVESANSTMWKSVRDTTSTWNSEPSVGWPGLNTPPWMATEPNFFIMGGVLGHRGQVPGLTDDYLGDDANVVWNRVMTGDLNPAGINPVTTAPALATQWALGEMKTLQSGGRWYTMDLRTEAAPEPGTMLLLTVGLLGMGARLRKKMMN